MDLSYALNSISIEILFLTIFHFSSRTEINVVYNFLKAVRELFSKVECALDHFSLFIVYLFFGMLDDLIGCVSSNEAKSLTLPLYAFIGFMTK